MWRSIQTASARLAKPKRENVEFVNLFAPSGYQKSPNWSPGNALKWLVVGFVPPCHIMIIGHRIIRWLKNVEYETERI